MEGRERLPYNLTSVRRPRPGDVFHISHERRKEMQLWRRPEECEKKRRIRDPRAEHDAN